jgi:outer membrane biosynthesis protein TonB
VLTYHYDNLRTGQNTDETILTPTSVASNFGKLFSYAVDGQVYAQPLYVTNLAIPNKGNHNIVFVNTENDSVYAFDADSNAGNNAAPLWHISLIDAAHGAAAGATPVPVSVYPVDSLNRPDCGALNPQIGSTSTPVIDPNSGVMYVEAFSLENGSYVHRLHALNITTGAEEPYGPVTVGGSVPGTGDGGTTVTFNAFEELNRPALLLESGTVYVAYASSCPDQLPYHGWVFAYNESNLAQEDLLTTTPNGSDGGIWMTGDGLAADAGGNVYAATGNGTFETTPPVTDFGNSVLKFTPSSRVLALSDYFTPYNQQQLNNLDKDLASGGIVLLPDQPGTYPHEMVAAGKEGRIYLLNRDQFTAGNQHYCANCTSDPQIIEESVSGYLNGVFSTPVYWNSRLYYWTPSLYLISIPMSNGLLNFSNSSTSLDSYGWPGANLAVSANGTSNGILWALKTDAFSTGGAAVLRAYDANNVSDRIYSSDQKPNDAAGPAVKFTAPIVVNGKVYVGSANQLSVYGLSGTPTPTPTATPTPTPSPTSSITPTPIPTPTPTPMPTPTPIPTPTLTPTPTPTPSSVPTPSIVALPITGNGCSQNEAGNTLNLGTPNGVVSAGDTLMVLVSGLAPGAVVTSITNHIGATGDVWQRAANVYGSDSIGGAIDIWYASNINAASNGANITVNTTSGNTFVSGCIFEVHGLASNPQDSGANVDITSNVSTLISPAIPGGSAPELFVAVSGCAGSGNATVAENGVQFTAINGGAANGVGGCPAGYYISSTNGLYQAGLSRSPPSSGVVGIASFMAAGATSTPTASPSGTPSPTSTATSTATPSPTSTPTPTKTPSPTSTPTPSATPSPTSSITPTPIPTPTPTPIPTPTLTPTPTPTPSSVPTPTIVALPTTGHGCSQNNRGNKLNLGTPNGVVTAGDTLIVLVSGLAPGDVVTSIANHGGAGGDVWQRAANVYGSDSNGGVVDIWYASNINAASNGANITVNTTSSNTFVGGCIFEVHGLASNPQDSGANVDITSNVSTLISPAIPGGSAPELFVAVSACANTGNATVAENGVQFTAINGGAGNGVGGCPAGYYISSTNGLYQAGLSQSPPGSGAVGIASFKPSQ